MKDAFMQESREEMEQERPGIVQIFGRKKLEEIQENIAKATGMAFVTVDYKGEPVTDTTCFTKFCQAIRDDKESCCFCKRSDAFGALQSAISMKPSVYFCPCGLLEVAIPLVDNGAFLGGFIGGQVICNDAPEELPRLANLFKPDKNVLDDAKMQGLKAEVKEYSYHQFMDVVNLIYMIINQMCANESSHVKDTNKLLERMEKSDEQCKRLEEQKKSMEQKLANLRMFHNQYFMANVLSSISSLIVLEHTGEANELILDLAEYMKSAACSSDTFWSLGEEIEQIERYIKLSCARFGEKFSCQIRIAEKIKNRRLPAYLLLPYVENAIFYGIALKEGEMMLSITGMIENKEAVLVIEENGPGYGEEELREKFYTYGGHHEGKYIDRAMYYAGRRFQDTFGEEYLPSITAERGVGRQIRIRIPAMIVGGMDSE